MNCPQCGNPTEDFNQGVCLDCCSENQSQLDDFNSLYDYWNGLDEKEQWEIIRKNF